MSLPAVRAVRRQFPEARITVLAKPWVSALYSSERSINEVIQLDAASGLKDLRAKRKIVRGLRHYCFDLAILLPNSFESAALVRLGGAKRIIGYARDARGPLLTDAIPLPKAGEIPAHERYYYLELLRRAGLIESLPEVADIRLDGIEELRAKGIRRFESLGIPLPVVGASPGAAYGSAKQWLPDRFAEAAAKLAATLGNPGSVAVFGSAGEKSMCQEVAHAANGHNLAGATTLSEFIELAAACRMFLTNDSGAMHIVSALGVPSVTIFGPTRETATGPTGPAAGIVREPVNCAPCLLRECPIDHRCMTRVSVDHVVAAAEELLKISPASVL